MIRSVAAVFAGLVLAFALVVGIEGIGAVVHPFPPDVDPTDMDVCRAHVARCPGWFLAVAVVLWGLTTLVSVWVATRLGTGRHPAHGVVVGVFLCLAAGFNMLMLPYPIWFDLGNLVAFPSAIYFGVCFGRGRAPIPESTANETEAS